MFDFYSIKIMFLSHLFKIKLQHIHLKFFSQSLDELWNNDIYDICYIIH